MPQVSTPDVGDTAGIVAPEVEGGDKPAVSMGDEPVTPASRSSLSDAQTADSAPSAQTMIEAAPNAAAETEVLAAPEIGETTNVGTEGTQVAALPATQAPELPIVPEVEVIPSVEPQIEFVPKVEAVPEIEDTPNIEAVPEVEPTPEVEPVPEVEELPKVETAPEAEETPKAEAMPEEALPKVEATPEEEEPKVEAALEAPAAIRVPVPEIGNLAPDVQINRLPTIGGEQELPQTDEQPAEIEEPAEDAEAPESELGALESYAMAFENPDAKPMMSLILIDSSEAPISDEALANLPFAISFAIDASRDDAGEVAKRYRAAGFEVLLLTNLPTGAKASDVEVAFEAYSKAIPEAVAVLDRGATSKVARQIAGILADRGFGLVTPSKGLNSAQKAAAREGVPSVLIYRELDADNEDPDVIRRYMDRAAFRAVQEGSVIMLGQTRAETVEALVQWALEDRAASVVMAPVSAVLKGQ